MDRMDATAFLALAGSVNRLISIIKPKLGEFGKSRGWSDNFYNIVLEIIAIIAGIFLAFASQANLVPTPLNISSGIGMIITGIVIGLGSDTLNAVLDFLYSGKKPLVDTGGAPVVGTGGPTVVIPPAPES
jgi:hypothetical protein